MFYLSLVLFLYAVKISENKLNGVKNFSFNYKVIYDMPERILNEEPSTALYLAH